MELETLHKHIFTSWSNLIWIYLLLAFLMNFELLVVTLIEKIRLQTQIDYVSCRLSLTANYVPLCFLVTSKSNFTDNFISIGSGNRKTGVLMLFLYASHSTRGFISAIRCSHSVFL